MTAKEALISAYNFYYRSPEGAGDLDLGAKGERIQTRRKARGPSWAVDPQHAKQSRAKAINTTGLVGDAMMAGKIISAAERGDPHVGAYARVYYGIPISGDYQRLYGYLAGVSLRRMKGDISMLNFGHNLIKSYATARSPGEYVINNEKLDSIISKLIHGLDSGVLGRVGKLLSDS